MVSEKTKARLWIAVLIFIDLAAGAALALLLGSGTSQPSGFLFLGIALVLALVSLVLAFSLRYGHARSLGLHGALLVGSIIFMFPFAWLIITSFKYPEEIVSYPPKWIPSVPVPLATSPYVTAELYDPVERPEVMEEAQWERLWPRMEETLWEGARTHIPREFRQDLEEEALRHVLVQALWKSLVSGMPATAWQQEEEALLRVLQQRVTAGRVADVWNTVYRCVAVREIFVSNFERFDYAVNGMTLTRLEKETDRSGEVTLRRLPLNLTAQEEMLQVAYALDEQPVAQLTFELPLPIPSSELLSITLPLRQDRTWHRTRFVVELEGRRYESRDALFLSGYRWQELTFKLADRDDEDERDVGVWPVYPVASADGVYDKPGHVRLTMEVERSSRLAAMWNKYASNYRSAWITGEYWGYYISNSVYLVIMNVIGQIISCSMVAYAFSRLRWPGREVLFFLVLATLMLPPQVTMIPVFLVFRSLGWYNTLKPLWVPAFAGGAFFVFLLRQFMKGIPRELEEAALIDGCSYFGIYWRIILPLVKPALAAVGIFTFMASWNEFMAPLIYISDQRLYPLALGLFDFRAEYGAEFGLLMAASSIMIVPVVVIFFFAQKYFIQGVTLTGMKN